MQGWTPLHCAAQGGHADMVDLLLSSGADASAQDAEVLQQGLPAAIELHVSLLWCM